MRFAYQDPVVFMQLFTNAAAALPCETGAGNERAQRERQFQILSPSQAAVALRRRLAAQRQRRQQVLLISAVSA